MISTKETQVQQKQPVLEKAKEQLGEPLAKCKKERFVSASCGDLSIELGTMAFLDKDDPTKYQDPITVWEGKVAGYVNRKGYQASVHLSEDPIELRNFANAILTVAKIKEKTGATLNRPAYVNVDEDKALEFFKK